MTSPIAASRPTSVSPLARRLIPLAVLVALAATACGGDATPSPAASLTPAPSTGDTAAMEALAATIPTQVGDASLTVGSGDLTYLSDKVPDYDLLVQGLQNAGVEPTDVIVAVGRPASGTDPTVAGLEVIQAPPGGLGLLGLMNAWFAGVEGATTQTTNIGKPVVKVTYADGSAPLYYYLYDSNRADQLDSDTMYFVRTADEALAEDALKQLP